MVDEGDRMNVYALEKQLNKIGRPPQTILEDLTKFRKDVMLLAEQRASLTKQHPDKWIAFYEGKVVFITDSLDELLVKIDDKKLPRDMVITQFLSTEKMVMIL